MKAKLCKAGIQLREQIDDFYPHRDRTSDGWIGDTRHSKRTSDHNPDAKGIVRAIDIDRDLSAHKEEAHGLVEQLRLAAKNGDKRIKYIIFDGKIMSPILGWKRRTYKGVNPHRHHFHVSFTTLGDNDSSWFDIGETNERSTKDGGNLAKDLPSHGVSDISSSGSGCRDHSKCCSCCRIA